MDSKYKFIVFLIIVAIIVVFSQHRDLPMNRNQNISILLWNLSDIPDSALIENATFSLNDNITEMAKYGAPDEQACKALISNKTSGLSVDYKDADHFISCFVSGDANGVGAGVGYISKSEYISWKSNN